MNKICCTNNSDNNIPTDLAVIEMIILVMLIAFFLQRLASVTKIGKHIKHAQKKIPTQYLSTFRHG